jgi:bifunctional non-homologous end joining protein LigD
MARAPQHRTAGPAFIAPMKAGIGELPRDDGWTYEIKWDGMRAIACLDPEAATPTRLWSVNHIEITVRFPELASLHESVGNSRAVLDGEIVALDQQGRPSFSLMQTRMHVDRHRDAVARAADVPVTFVAFDLLWLDGNDITSLPFSARRAALESVFEPDHYWRLSELHDDGDVLLDAVTDMRLEGVMAKRKESTYVPGSRSSAWRKVKSRLHDEFVVGGWTAGERGRQGHIGSLHIGYYRDGVLRHAGRVGSGLRESEIRTLEAIFAKSARSNSPFAVDSVPRLDARRAHWVEPQLVIEVAYTGWTNDGKLRHPVYLGRRLDKDPAAVSRPLSGQ